MGKWGVSGMGRRIDGRGGRWLLSRGEWVWARVDGGVVGGCWVQMYAERERIRGREKGH